MTPAKIHVGLVVHDFDAGYGQGRYCLELVRHLQDDIRFTVFANTFRAPAAEQITWIKVPAWRFDALTSVFSFIPFSERLVRKHRPDLVHAQGLTCWQSDIITGHICNAARAKQMNTRWLKPRLFARLVIPFERAFFQNPNARHVIAISRILEDEVRREYAWNKPVTVIYHGTDSQLFRPSNSPDETKALRARFNLPSSRWTWLFIGEAVKGLRQAIDQLPAFPNAHLLVITRSNLAMYRSQAAVLGVTDRITFHGPEKSPEEAYRAVDLFLYPSDYDPFGMVVTEAMATGIPVAIGRGLGAAELVDHRENGLKFDPHSPEDIRRCLEWIAADPERGRAMGSAGRQQILRHSWEVCARKTLGVYQRVYREKFGA
jgi:glycosyltransferase involved in cell wall biosynthesis